MSDTVLNYLARAREDPELNRVFRGVFPADKLPTVPKWRVFSDAYIVNTDLGGEPGEHWLAIWTRNRVCDMFDSYGLPLSSYKYPTLQAWFKQWREVITSDQTLQATDSYNCGHCALLFLKAKARNASFQDFLAQWHSHNLVLNDRRVGEKIRRLIKTELTRRDELSTIQCKPQHLLLFLSINMLSKTSLCGLFKGTSMYVDTLISNTIGRTRRRVKRKGQKGGARFRRKPRLVDKIAEGVGMRLSGPSLSFAKMGAFLAKQALKGIKDNVQHYRRRK